MGLLGTLICGRIPKRSNKPQPPRRSKSAPVVPFPHVARSFCPKARGEVETREWMTTENDEALRVLLGVRDAVELHYAGKNYRLSKSTSKPTGRRTSCEVQRRHELRQFLRAELTGPEPTRELHRVESDETDIYTNLAPLRIEITDHELPVKQPSRVECEEVDDHSAFAPPHPPYTIHSPIPCAAVAPGYLALEYLTSRMDMGMPRPLSPTCGNVAPVEEQMLNPYHVFNPTQNFPQYLDPPVGRETPIMDSGSSDGSHSIPDDLWSDFSGDYTMQNERYSPDQDSVEQQVPRSSLVIARDEHEMDFTIQTEYDLPYQDSIEGKVLRNNSAKGLEGSEMRRSDGMVMRRVVDQGQ